jgi:hypothetical protein
LEKTKLLNKLDRNWLNKAQKYRGFFEPRPGQKQKFGIQEIEKQIKMSTRGQSSKGETVIVELKDNRYISED